VLALASVACAEPSAMRPQRLTIAAGSGISFALLVDDSGVIAWRPGGEDADPEWLPPGDAALLDAVWWSLAKRVRLAPSGWAHPRFAHGDVTTSVRTDLDGDGTAEYVVSYRHRARTVPWDSRPQPTDRFGRTAHLGVVRADGTPIWLSHRIPGPIGALAGCDPAIALAYTGLDDSTVVASTAGTWVGFGFELAPELPGNARVGCADIDGDGVLDPVLLRGG